MTSKEALERIIRSHHIAMAMLCEGRKDDKTEKAIEIIKQDLDELDDIKELQKELSINLVTLFKALKNGIWIKTTIIEKGKIKNLFFFYENVNLYKDCLYACPVDIYDERVYLRDHGITWALTKEELE